MGDFDKSCLGIILFTIVLFLAFSIFFIAFGFYISPIYDTLENKNHLSAITKNFVQVLFFIVTAAVAVFSYYQARKGLFNPVKTEIFKEQFKILNQFQPIFGVINNKVGIEIAYGIPTIKLVNLYNIMFDYLKIELEQDDEEGKKYIENRYDVVSRIYFGNQKVSIKNLKGKEVNNWNDYEVKEILITREFNEIQERIKELIVSPLLPKEFKNKLTSLYDEAHKCISLIHQELEKLKIELPDKFDATPEMNPMDYMDEIKLDEIDLFSKYNECVNFLAEYLKVEEIIKK